MINNTTLQTAQPNKPNINDKCDTKSRTQTSWFSWFSKPNLDDALAILKQHIHSNAKAKNQFDTAEKLKEIATEYQQSASIIYTGLTEESENSNLPDGVYKLNGQYFQKINKNKILLTLYPSSNTTDTNNFFFECKDKTIPENILIKIFVNFIPQSIENKVLNNKYLEAKRITNLIIRFTLLKELPNSTILQLFKNESFISSMKILLNNKDNKDILINIFTSNITLSELLTKLDLPTIEFIAEMLHSKVIDLVLTYLDTINPTTFNFKDPQTININRRVILNTTFDKLNLNLNLDHCKDCKLRDSLVDLKVYYLKDTEFKNCTIKNLQIVTDAKNVKFDNCEIVTAAENVKFDNCDINFNCKFSNENPRVLIKNAQFINCTNLTGDLSNIDFDETAQVTLNEKSLSKDLSKLKDIEKAINSINRDNPYNTKIIDNLKISLERIRERF